MKKIIFLLLTLLPGILMAHPLPVEHEHLGLLNGWEPVVIALLLTVAIVFFVRKLKSQRHR